MASFRLALSRVILLYKNCTQKWKYENEELQRFILQFFKIIVTRFYCDSQFVRNERMILPQAPSVPLFESLQ